jgi:competence protein ComEA
MFKFITTLVLAFASAAAFAAVDANKASIAELEAIKGIGTNMAARIVEARQTTPFTNWGDLTVRVKGVGPGNAAKFSAEGLTVGGAAFNPADVPAKAPGKRAAKAEAKKAGKAPDATK